MSSHEDPDTPPPAQAVTPATRGIDTRIAVAIGAVVLVVAVIGGYLLFRGPSELAPAEYARTLCDDVLKPVARDMKDVFSGDVHQEIERAQTDRTAREKAIDTYKEDVDKYNGAIEAVADFNDDNVMSGADGSVYRDELTSAVDDWANAYDVVLDDLDELDPADQRLLTTKIGLIDDELVGVRLTSSAAATYRALVAALNDRNAECGSAYESLVRLSS